MLINYRQKIGECIKFVTVVVIRRDTVPVAMDTMQNAALVGTAERQVFCLGRYAIDALIDERSNVRRLGSFQSISSQSVKADNQ